MRMHASLNCAGFNAKSGTSIHQSKDFAAVESKVEEQAEAAWAEALKNHLAAKKHRQLLVWHQSDTLQTPPHVTEYMTLGRFSLSSCEVAR